MKLFRDFLEEECVGDIVLQRKHNDSMERGTLVEINIDYIVFRSDGEPNIFAFIPIDNIAGIYTQNSKN